MRNQKTQAFVLVSIIIFAALVFVYRTTHYWQNMERQTIKDSLSSQLVVLATNIEQLSSDWVNLVKSSAVNEQIIFRGNVAKSESGNWQIKDSKGDRNEGLEFVKQIHWEKVGPQIQWIARSNGQGEAMVGLVLPDVIAGQFLVGVIDSPFKDLTSLYKGSFSSIFVLDKKLSLVGHSKEGYVGTRYDFGKSNGFVKNHATTFIESKDGRGLSNFTGTFQLPELNLIMGASIAKKFVLLQYVQWLFEVIAFILAATGILTWWMMRRPQELVRTQSVAPMADRGGHEILKNLSGALSEQLSGPIDHLLSYFRLLKSKEGKENRSVDAKDLADVERESEKIREVVDTLQTVGRPTSGRKEPVNLEQMLKVMMVEIKTEAVKLGIDFSDSLLPVGDIVANSSQIRSLIHSLKKMAFFNVRFEKQKRISMDLKGIGNRLQLTVTDNGPKRNVGLEDVLAEPAYYDQMGLSIPLVHSIVKVYAGTLDIKSDNSMGNSIIITLPTDGSKPVSAPVSYTHLTLPTNREV